MFGRDFTGSGHRQHVLPPSPSSYSFEKVGSTKKALGLSGLSVGDEVYWYAGGDDVDTSASGVIVEMPAVDPDGRVHSDMAAVEWADEGYDIVEINNLLNAEHYNIGQGYSHALGSRKQADAYMDELKEWHPVEYDAFMESLGPGTVYEPGELEVIHKKWQQTQDPFDEGGDSYSASRKQASSLTWGHETAEQSMLGEDVWFAHSGDGFHASVAEESPGSGRFTVDAFTDSDQYSYLSTTEHGFESVDEAKGFVDQIFGDSRVSSRTASKCPKCDGMGRETYETDTGSLSTQTCTACGGTGQAKEAARRTAKAYFGKPSSSSQAHLLQKYSKPSKLRSLTFEDLDGLEQFVKAQLEMCPMDSIEVDDVLRGIKAARKWKEKNGYTSSRKVAMSPDVVADEIDRLFSEAGGWSPITSERLDWSKGDIEFYGWIGQVSDWSSNPDDGVVFEFQGGTEAAVEAAKYVIHNENFNGFVPAPAGGRFSRRRTAFLDTVHLAEPKHRVAGWDWDDHLNGFIAAEAAREFTCACGDNVPAPGYTDCRCGKRWNAYTVSANGSKKMIAREVPVRENVVMARTAHRKTAAEGWDLLIEIADDAAEQYRLDTGNDPFTSPDFLTQYLNLWIGANPYAQNVDQDELRDAAEMEGYGGYTW